MATVKTKAKRKLKVPLDTILKAGATLTRLPWDKLDIFYDREVDVLYISIGGPPQSEEEGELREEDGMMLGYRDGELTSITIWDASQR